MAASKASSGKGSASATALMAARRSGGRCDLMEADGSTAATSRSCGLVRTCSGPHVEHPPGRPQALAHQGGDGRILPSLDRVADAVFLVVEVSGGSHPANPRYAGRRAPAAGVPGRSGMMGRWAAPTNICSATSRERQGSAFRRWRPSSTVRRKRYARQIGLAEGWHVWEVGAGGPSLPEWFAGTGGDGRPGSGHGHRHVVADQCGSVLRGPPARRVESAPARRLRSRSRPPGPRPRAVPRARHRVDDLGTAPGRLAVPRGGRSGVATAGLPRRARSGRGAGQQAEGRIPLPHGRTGCRSRVRSDASRSVYSPPDSRTCRPLATFLWVAGSATGWSGRRSSRFEGGWSSGDWLRRTRSSVTWPMSQPAVSPWPPLR